jgi:hypothetical protein
MTVTTLEKQKMLANALVQLKSELPMIAKVADAIPVDTKKAGQLFLSLSPAAKEFIRVAIGEPIPDELKWK